MQKLDLGAVGSVFVFLCIVEGNSFFITSETLVLHHDHGTSKHTRFRHVEQSGLKEHPIERGGGCPHVLTPLPTFRPPGSTAHTQTLWDAEQGEAHLYTHEGLRHRVL